MEIQDDIQQCKSPEMDYIYLLQNCILHYHKSNVHFGNFLIWFIHVILDGKQNTYDYVFLNSICVCLFTGIKCLTYGHIYIFITLRYWIAIHVMYFGNNDIKQKGSIGNWSIYWEDAKQLENKMFIFSWQWYYWPWSLHLSHVSWSLCL